MLNNVNQAEGDKEREEKAKENEERSYRKELEQEGIKKKDVESLHPGALEEPEFQPEPNQHDNDQIGEPPQHKSDSFKFNGTV